MYHLLTSPAGSMVPYLNCSIFFLCRGRLFRRSCRLMLSNKVIIGINIGGVRAIIQRFRPANLSEWPVICYVGTAAKFLPRTYKLFHHTLSLCKTISLPHSILAALTAIAYSDPPVISEPMQMEPSTLSLFEVPLCISTHSFTGWPLEIFTATSCTGE